MTTTITTICQKYNITPEQFDKATHRTSNGEHFYIVESQSQPGVEYKVTWNAEHQCLQCLPHTGPACKASENGVPCWHKRAALAVEEHYKAQVRRERANEQARIEATEEYQFEQAMRDLEDALDALDAMAEESDERKALSFCGILA